MFPLIAALMAHVAVAETPLDDTRIEVETLDLFVDGLEARIAGDYGFMDASLARERFEEALLAHLVGDHVEAAEGFFLLTQLLDEDALRRDAQWYLAVSLQEIGSLELAEDTLRDIDADPQHPFREAASFALLEAYATRGRVEDFLSYYAQAAGRITPSDALTYTLGKSFYQLGHLDRAHALLEDLPPSSDHYGRARYLLGAIHVSEGNLDEANTHFKDVLAVSIDDATDRSVYDLTVMALARIAYERGHYAEAAEHYGSVSGDSKYLADQLYEQIWTLVRLEDDAAAMGTLELFMLHFPDHAYTGHLKLVRGHLEMRRKRWEQAAAQYEEVLSEYRPLRGGAFDDMPEWMKEQIASQPELRSAKRVVSDLEHQAELLEDASAVALELGEIVATAPILKRHEQAHVDTATGLRAALLLSLRVVALDARAHQGREIRARSNALRARHQDLKTAVQSVDVDEDMAVYEARAASERLLHLREPVRELSYEVATLQPNVRRKKQTPTLSALSARVEALIGRLVAADQEIHRQATAAREPLRERVLQQREFLTANTARHQELRRTGEQVLHTAEGHGVQAVDIFLAGAIRQADMGLADAAWNELVDVVQQRETATREKHDKLLLLQETVEELRGRYR